MKRIFGLMFSLLAAVLLVGCATKTTAAPAAAEKVAMITDYGDITDQSFNQATYEGCKSWCEANGVEFKYYRPAGNTTADRVSSCEQAIEAGYTILVMPGYAFAGTIEEIAGPNPDIKIIALDVSAGDFSQGYTLPSNVYCAVYQEEIAGFLAGYAAVKEGYTKLGFLGGMAVPAVVRYGQGFVQGADKAAQEMDKEIEIKYVYGGQFFGDADITDQSFNQATYEGCKDWGEKNGVEFKYYKPASNSDADRIASTKEAIADGYNVIVMPGYAFAPTIEAVALKYPDVHFIALDVSLGDLLAAHFGEDYDYNPENPAWSNYALPKNVYCAVYQEEIAGFFAGYAAVKEG